MNQEVINWIAGGFAALMGAILKSIWDAVKDLQQEDKEMTEKLSAVELLVVGDYVKRSELVDCLAVVSTQLQLILEKLDKKADK